MKKSVRSTAGWLLALSVGVGLVACSSPQASEDEATSGETETATLSGDCGVLPHVDPQDPDGTLAALSEESQELYNGYSYELYTSSWADWKPEGDGPYTVGVVFGPLRNAHQTALYEAAIAELEASPLVENVIATTTTGDDASAQIQQFNSVIQQGADILIYQPVAADAAVAPVDEAAAQGIPVVIAQSRVNTPNAVNVNPNQYLSSGSAIAEMINLIGGEGKLLGVHGVPAFAADAATFDVASQLIDACPGLEMVGEVVGNFDASVAKTEVMSFLSTYPGEIDGVIQTAVMAPGIISAFVESGIEVPTVVDYAAQQGSIGWWYQNRDTYHGVGIGQGAEATGQSIADVALGMLAGGGIKVSDVILDPMLITDENLAEWADPSWDLTSVGTAPAPQGLPAVSASYLAEVFKNPLQ